GNSVNHLPDAFIGSSYSYTMTALNGQGGLTWSAIGLPAGMTMSAAGVLSGAPTTCGFPYCIVPITVTVSDGTDIVSRDLSITVNRVNLVTPGMLPNGTQGASYSKTLTANGGTPPYTFTVTGGNLP